MVDVRLQIGLNPRCAEPKEHIFTKENLWALLVCLLIALLVIFSADHSPFGSIRVFKCLLTKVLILIGAALIIRLVFPGKLRKWALQIASVVAIYWLQPVLPIRNMDFWFPTATIGLVFVIWGLTAEKTQLTERRNWLAALLTTGTILLIGLTRFVSLEGILTASRPPQVFQVLISLFIIYSWDLF